MSNFVLSLLANMQGFAVHNVQYTCSSSGER